ncbi:hypothetical protein LNP74_06100 [Klebsiella pneumoniae subsp. pneumoniae]|nr:hypothetical protein [Klebsiella pneumoniae subsp. pneumoniae]
MRGGAGTALVGNPQQVAERIPRISGARHQQLYLLRLPTSGRSAPLC